MTFVRAYVNLQTAEMYKILFQEVFRIICQQVGQLVQWQHIHKAGFGCIVMDMDSTQMSGKYYIICIIYSQCINNTLGFGHYLSELDHRHRPWQWHVQSAIIYCTIHFKRGIIRATGTSLEALELQRRMEQLLYVQSSDEYFQLCDLLISMKRLQCIKKTLLIHYTSIRFRILNTASC